MILITYMMLIPIPGSIPPKTSKEKQLVTPERGAEVRPASDRDSFSAQLQRACSFVSYIGVLGHPLPFGSFLLSFAKKLQR